MSFPRESSSVLTNSPHSGIFFFNISFYFYQGFPDSSVGKKFASNVGVMGLIPGLGRFPWRRERLLTPVFWPGEFHELYSSCDTKSRTQLSDFHFSLYFIKKRYVFIYCCWDLVHFSLYFILKNIYLLIAALGLAARRLFRCSVQASLYCGVQVQ